MMKEKTTISILLIVIAFLLVLLLCAGGAGYFGYRIYKKTLTENANLNIKDREYRLREQRLECMTYTLMAAYGLSKWEAHYYSIIFDDFSTRYNTPWEIYPSIIRIETNFRSTLVSPKSAKGIMQIMEETGKQMASEIGMDYVEKETLWNDFCNMILGCYYLSKFIKEQGLEGGVRSYLGGPGWEKTSAASKSVSQSIGEYRTSVGKEFRMLTYMFRGISAERGCKYNEVHTSAYSDTTRFDIEPFSYITNVNNKK